MINYDSLKECNTLYNYPLKPLVVEILLRTQDDMRIALAHHKVVNGDVVPDPEVIIKVNLKRKYLEALSYQDEFGFRAIYDEKGNIEISARDEINDFLSKWLRRLKIEEYKL